MKKTLSLLAIMIILAVNVNARDFRVDGICYDICDDGKSVAVVGDNYESLKGELIIPNSVKHKGKTYVVRKIEAEAFIDCHGLTSVVIPNSVTSLGTSAFSGCSGLITVSIPNTVTDLGGAFSGCSSLTSVIIPNSVTEIGGAFSDCTSLASVALPDSLTAIGWYAFKGCKSLVSLVIPSSVTAIGSSAFSGCSALTSVSLPDSLVVIEAFAFEDCTNLTSVTIPSSIIRIGEGAFSGCSSLEFINSLIKNPQDVIYVSKDFPTASIFENINKSNCIINVPNGSEILYKKMFPWAAFAKIEERDYGIEELSNDSQGQGSQQKVEKNDYAKLIKDAEQMIKNPELLSNPANYADIVDLARELDSHGEIDVVTPIYEAAVEMCKRNDIAGNKLGVADLKIHYNVANRFFIYEEYDKARDYYEAVLKYIEDNDIDSYDIIEIQKNIAVCYSGMRKYDKAREHYETILNRYKDKIEVNGNDYADIQEAIGECYINTEEYERALGRFEAVLEIYKSRKEDENILYMQEKIGDCYFYMKEWEEARKRYEAALGIIDKKSSQSYEVARIHEKIGRCFYANKDIDSAMLEYYEAWNICDISDSNPFWLFDRYVCIELCKDISRCKLSKEDYNLVYDIFSQTIDKEYYKSLDDFKSRNAKQRTDYWDYHSNLFQDNYPAVTLEAYKLAKDDSYQNLIGDLYNKSALFAKGLLLTSESELKRIILGSGNRNLIGMFYKLQNHPNEALEADLLAVANEYDDFTKKLKLNWVDVEKSLGDNSIAIEFLSYQKFGAENKYYMALTLKKGYTQPKIIELCEEIELKDGIDRAYTTNAISEKIWKPLATELKGVKNIYFSPSGELHKIAIESMPHWEKPGVLMCDSTCFNIYRLSSTRELAIKHSGVQGKGGAAIYAPISSFNCDTTAMIAALIEEPINDISFVTTSSVNEDPVSNDFSGSDYVGYNNKFRSVSRNFDLSASGFKCGIPLPDLGSTRFEVTSINEVLSSWLGEKNVEFKQDTLATETSFKRLSGKKKQIIHIATHGFYWDETKMQNDNNPPFLQPYNAMTRSGLLFSGAQHIFECETLPEKVDDGVLTAHEISNLDLRGLDMLVLSACKTGLGDVGSDGVFGLQRGFKKAGAQSIVMSLWPVHDVATKDFMVKFYEGLFDSAHPLTVHQAFLEAQQYVKSNDSKYDYDPEAGLSPTRPHWAAFILLDAVK